jgi:hypothetical protein
VKVNGRLGQRFNRVPPGVHTVEVTAPGHRAAVWRVELFPGEERMWRPTLRIAVEPRIVQPAPGHRIQAPGAAPSKSAIPQGPEARAGIEAALLAFALAVESRPAGELADAFPGIPDRPHRRLRALLDTEGITGMRASPSLQGLSLDGSRATAAFVLRLGFRETGGAERETAIPFRDVRLDYENGAWRIR